MSLFPKTPKLASQNWDFCCLKTLEAHMKRQISMCIFMSMIFISIEIKFDIEINNDELLIIWEHNKKENCHW